MPRKCVRVELADLNGAIESNMGFCMMCEEFTTDCCEPDAEAYVFDECENRAVYGAEQALLLGLITL